MAVVSKFSSFLKNSPSETYPKISKCMRAHRITFLDSGFLIKVKTTMKCI